MRSTMSETEIDLSKLTREHFGDTPALADELLSLILAGKKTASCGAAQGSPPGVVGEHYIVLDSQGRDRALLRVVSVEKRRFCDVTPELAFLEGEGDRSLDYWRSAHQAYFERNGGFSEDMDLWCEVFELVRAL
jgi:uncharacterized protein YhfF